MIKKHLSIRRSNIAQHSIRSSMRSWSMPLIISNATNTWIDWKLWSTKKNAWLVLKTMEKGSLFKSTKGKGYMFQSWSLDICLQARTMMTSKKRSQVEGMATEQSLLTSTQPCLSWRLLTSRKRRNSKWPGGTTCPTNPNPK